MILHRILASKPAFWLFLALLAVGKMAVVWNQSVAVVLGPHDDSLYVSRALSLLAGNGFGPYTSSTLLKFPGLSIWLAGGTLLELPYLRSLNFLYAAAGLYLCSALRSTGAPRYAIATGYLLYLFNPFTFDIGWTRILREPLATVLLTTILASLLSLMSSVWRGRILSLHFGVFVAALAFASLVREEDVLLLLIPILAAAFLAVAAPGGRQCWAQAALLGAVPLVVAAITHAAVGTFVERHYGTPLRHDFGEGEFPKMVAAMRSIASKRDNRYVMISQETLAALRREVPRLEPVIRRLPQPSRSTVSCEWLGVCSEWASGWLPFWIKDAAYDAGLTPDLPSGQAFFRAVREDIARACASGRLACTPKGDGLIPPFELRWARALAQEAGRLLHMLAWPERFARQTPTSAHGPRLDALFAAATGSIVTAAPAAPPVKQEMPFGRGLRQVYGWMAFALIAGMIGVCVLVLWSSRQLPRGPLAVCICALAGYVGVRLALLSYIAITMGRYDPRMVMSSHILLVALAPCIIILSLDWRREKK